jgi:hypothetical protein
MTVLSRIYLAALFSVASCKAGYAQLTIFNVSASDISEARKVGVQQQFEIEDQIESSTTINYGLGKGWEVGLNLINVDYNYKTRHFESNDTTTATPYAPLLLGNVQKIFQLTDHFSTSLGAVAGTNMKATHGRRFVYYGYANLLAEVGDRDQYQFVAGPYLSNHRYLSNGPVYGVQSGVDLGFWYKKVHLLADWISGSHDKGRLTAGIEIFLSERIPLALGWQRSNADGAQGAVFQLTILPK